MILVQDWICGASRFPFAYKYGVLTSKKMRSSAMRTAPTGFCAMRRAGQTHASSTTGLSVLPADTWQGAGVAIPVFSLRSENSFGVGEFADLKLLADWGRQAGLKLIQILPVNDTSATHTWKDSYPYAAISAFALHPIYLNLTASPPDGTRVC